MGANQGVANGNKQKAEYEEPGKKTWETRSERTGKTKEAKAEGEHRRSHCEAETGRKRKGSNRGQVARTGREANERKRIERGKPESESKREAPEEQLWERIREGRKETNRKPSTKNRERRHGKLGRKERGKPKKRKQKWSTEEATVRQNREEGGKEETEAE